MQVTQAVVQNTPNMKEETLEAIVALKSIKPSIRNREMHGRVEFIKLALGKRVYNDILADRFKEQFDITSSDIQSCFEMGDGESVIHRIVEDTLNSANADNSALGLDVPMWNSWCSVYDSIEKARAVDKYKGVEHMCNRFTALYGRACKISASSPCPITELAQIETALAPIDYRELFCLVSLLLQERGAYTPLQIGKRAYTGNINTAGMDPDLITWIRTFPENVTPNIAIKQWKEGWRESKELATNQSLQMDSDSFSNDY